MEYLSQIVFLLVLGAATWVFVKNVGKIRRNILLGRDEDRTDHPGKRWKMMARVALGQSKMVVRPVAGIMHIFVYLGFVLINIEVLEIIIDGIAGTHRIFSEPLGSFYGVVIGFFEILALLVILGCVVFLARRHVLKLARFIKPEMKGWPTKDATYILVIEIVLMIAILVMNAADGHFQAEYGAPISGMLAPMFAGMDADALHLVERTAWWAHIIGILLFMNYLPYSKHFHIILAFPNTYYSNLTPKGKLGNMSSVTNEVKMMLDPSFTPPEGASDTPATFGAKDVQDLTWKNIMDSYTCTECGRCTSNCPANQTGKKLSPRKVMMDVRDRAEEVGNNIDKHGKDHQDDKTLHNYITAEELWACTTCNACVESCPVNINPMEIIVDLRRYLVMEQSSAPAELNNMFTNMENNGAPWQFSPADRLNWAENINE